jgi:capsular polysaccharide biosynthesis protein
MDIKEIIKNKTFWIASLALASMIFFVAMSSSKMYQSDMDVLFLPKSEVSVSNIEQIIANAKQIPFSLSFYDKLVENNPDIDDEVADLPDAARKDFWNSKIETKQLGKSGVVRITIFSSDQMQAEMLSRQTANNLVIAMSRYYNIKTDLDMRIIDGPIVSQTGKTNIFLIIFLSLIFGLILGLFVSLLTELIVDRIKNEKDDRQTEFKKQPLTLANFSFPILGGAENKKTLPAEPENVFDFNIKKEREIAEPAVVEESFRVSEKKAAAPANLPIAEEEIPFDFKSQPEKEMQFVEKIVSDAVSKDTSREATPEEVKARLNKLLSGDILK